MNAYELAKQLEERHAPYEDDAANMLRQQADKIAKYEEALHAIANDYHELSDHKIEVQVRNHKKWAMEALSSSGNSAQKVNNINQTLPKGKV